MLRDFGLAKRCQGLLRCFGKVSGTMLYPESQIRVPSILTGVRVPATIECRVEPSRTIETLTKPYKTVKLQAHPYFSFPIRVLQWLPWVLHKLLLGGVAVYGGKRA